MYAGQGRRDAANPLYVWCTLTYLPTASAPCTTPTCTYAWSLGDIGASYPSVRIAHYHVVINPHTCRSHTIHHRVQLPIGTHAGWRGGEAMRVLQLSPQLTGHPSNSQRVQAEQVRGVLVQVRGLPGGYPLPRHRPDTSCKSASLSPGGFSSYLSFSIR